MCGIFAILNNSYTFNEEFIHEQFMKCKKRGPEFSKLEKMLDDCYFGFHRLAINGLNAKSNQPICIDNMTLICNGEIYNYKELYTLMGLTPKTDSDCEVIIHLYKKYGIEQTLQMLDGVFSFVLMIYDKTQEKYSMIVARDPYGVRPMYQLTPKRDDSPLKFFGFASECKCLNEFYNVQLNRTHKLEQFKPGSYSVFSRKTNQCWLPHFQNKEYHSTGFTSIMYSEKINNCESNMIAMKCDNVDLVNSLFSNVQKYSVISNIQHYFTNAVKKRVLVTERPIACLLSGGLDSSLVTALVNEIYGSSAVGPLETYSIGLAGSEDLKYARIVADYLKTKHTEIVITEQEYLAAIPEVIQAIESYDTTSVRASVGNYLVAKYISQNSDAKVIFNGDGSDELCGGYLYMHAAPDAIEFDRECRRLLKDIHMYDVLRSDKCISSNGLEPRTPFLDRSFVQYYLSIHPSLRYHKGNGQCEKFLLRNAFSKDHFCNKEGKPLLPDAILWRTKEAFSDGVTKLTRSLPVIIENFVMENDGTFLQELDQYKKAEYLTHNKPETPEQKYYRALFERFYPGMSHLVPYFWMPKYVDATDASARSLKIYSQLLKADIEKELEQEQYDHWVYRENI